MKLSHPAAIKSAALLLSAVLRTWAGTLSSHTLFDDPASDPSIVDPSKVYLFWHEMMVLPACLFVRRARVSVLISKHRDGELVAQAIHYLGGKTVRGSTNKHGMTAMRELMRRGKLGHLAITPDGPRGPRRVVQPGAIYIASRGEMQIVPCGFAFANCKRVKSWDKMAFPIPGTTAQGVFGKPIFIPPELDREGIEANRLIVQAAMDDCQQRAEELAAPYKLGPGLKIRQPSREEPNP
ncbi:hypothetical protein BH10PLA1_BH10PLA1_07920 [soil metagenome]